MSTESALEGVEEAIFSLQRRVTDLKLEVERIADQMPDTRGLFAALLLAGALKDDGVAAGVRNGEQRALVVCDAVDLADMLVKRLQETKAP